MAKLERAGDGGDDVELEAFRRLYPSEFLHQFLKDGVRPDGRPLGRSRSTLLTVGSLPSAEGSAMVKLGNTTMLAGVKLEVMPSPVDAPDEGCIAVDFQMPAICSPVVRPGRKSELEPVISEQIKNALSSTSMVDLRELSIAPGKAAWMAYLDIYCLDSDGSLLDAALLAATAALAHLKIPDVAITDDGKVFPANTLSPKTESAQSLKNVQGKRLKLGKIPMALTCAVHPNYVLPDPTAEEETILKTSVIVLTDFSGQLVSCYKPGGEVLASTSTVQNCISLARYRGKELQKIFEEAVTTELDNDNAMDAD
eukprot:c18403_g1_i1 orf=496-1428(-)